MTTVKELIEYLKQFPEDTEVEVFEEESYFYETCVNQVPLNLDPL